MIVIGDISRVGLPVDRNLSEVSMCSNIRKSRGDDGENGGALHGESRVGRVEECRKVVAELLEVREA